MTNLTEQAPCQCDNPVHMTDQQPDAPLFRRLRWHSPEAMRTVIRKSDTHAVCFPCNNEHERN